MMGLKSWRLGWLLGCLGLGLSLLAGCDTSHEADSRVSRIRLVIDPGTLDSSVQGTPQSPNLALTRQVLDPFDISSILVEAHVPQDPEPITEVITDVTESVVEVFIEVPQEAGVLIQVFVTNPHGATIYSGETVVDLFLPVHDVELFLSPVFSVNVAYESTVSADRGAQFTVNSEAAGLVDLNVNIPPGALDRDTVVVVGTRNHATSLPPLPPGVTPMGPVLAFEADGAFLLSPMMLNLPYDEFGLSNLGLGPEALRFYHLDIGMSAWSEGTVVGVNPNAVTMDVDLTAFGSGVIVAQDQ